MESLELDASHWKNVEDFYNALLPALGAPQWHGHNLNALLDSIIWHDDINQLKPPYVIRVNRTKGLPPDVIDEITLLKDALVQDRRVLRKDKHVDVEVSVEISP
jgi:hypothetical protein